MPNAPFRPILITLATLLAACGGGGGDATPASPSPILLELSKNEAQAGEVLVARSASPIFSVGAGYSVRWSAGDNEIQEVPAGASSTTEIGVFVPFLAAGEYECFVTVPGGGAEFRLRVSETAVPSAPAAVLAEVRTGLLNAVDTLRTTATSEPDPTLRARRLADVAALEAAHAEYEAAAAQLAPNDVIALATFWHANLTGTPLPAMSGVDRINEATTAMVLSAAQFTLGAAMTASGLVLLFNPVTIGLDKVIALGAIALGLASMNHGYDDFVAAFRRRVIEQLLRVDAPQSNDRSTAIRLVHRIPQPLVADVEFRSVLANDRQSLGHRLQAFFQTLDQFAGAVTALPAIVTERFTSPAPALPTTNFGTETERTPATNLVLVASSNPDAALTLTGGAITAELRESVTEASTFATFELPLAGAGSLTVMTEFAISRNRGTLVVEGLGRLQATSTAYDVSKDGQVIVGTSGNRAFRWRESTGMVDLGSLPDTSQTLALATDGDGDTVAGWTWLTSLGAFRAFRWNAGAAFSPLAPAVGMTDSCAFGVSANGSTIVGYSFNYGTPNSYVACRWTGGSASLLPGLSGQLTSGAYAANDDGSVLVGFSQLPSGRRAVRWSQGSIEDLGTPAGGSSAAGAVSGDGTVVVGGYEAATGPRAFRWTELGGFTDLGAIGATGQSSANAVTADGFAIVGTSRPGSSGNQRAVLWPRSGGLESLPTLGSGASYAFAVDGPGNTIVGASQGEAVRWVYR